MQYARHYDIIKQNSSEFTGEKMSTYRIAICDDDDIIRENLCSLCSDILTNDSAEYRLEPFCSVCELEKRLNAEGCPFDLLILDIQMDGMTGMELARSLREKGNRVSIIFVTACEDYLSEWYGVQPIHFLLKPVHREALASAIHTDLKLNYIPKTVVVHIGNKLVHLSLSDFEKQLPMGQFARCHNSYLVNLDEVREIGRTELSLQSGETLPMGRSYYKAFQSAFVRYINQ